MKSLGEVLKLSTSFLEERKIDRPRRSAEDILAFVLKCKRMDLYMQFDRPIVENELAAVRELIKRRAKGEPLEYLFGEAEFHTADGGCRIKIDRRVLIPRQETEILADLIVKRLKPRDLSGLQLWELCTGSGYLGISLKKSLPGLSVTLSDISKDAIALASENAKANGAEVEILEGDLLAPFKGRSADFVVCNPPYVSESEFLNLDPSVRDYEPRIALVGGERGTEFYERLSRELPPFLKPKAEVFFEIGSNQGEAVKQIFSDPIWTSSQIINDWAGHPRFFFLEKQ